MKVAAAIFVLCLSLVLPTRAAVTPAQLTDVKVDVPPNAALPLSLPFVDDTGAPRTLRQVMGAAPAVVIFADYTCTNLCGPILAFTAAALKKSGLAPGKDFHLIAVGLDPKDGPAQARAMKASRVGGPPSLMAATVFLIGKPDSIRAATQAVGYHYVYDTEHDQFAHPAAAFVLGKDGRIVRVLSGLGLSGPDLRLALVDAGRGKVGSVFDQIRLRCFGFDPARGIYTASISRMLTIAGVSSAVLLLGFILAMTSGLWRGVKP